MRNGRSGGIRTPGPLVPNQMRYQAALHSDAAVFMSLTAVNQAHIEAQIHHSRPRTGNSRFAAFPIPIPLAVPAFSSRTYFAPAVDRRGVRLSAGTSVIALTSIPASSKNSMSSGIRVFFIQKLRIAFVLEHEQHAPVGRHPVHMHQPVGVLARRQGEFNGECQHRPGSPRSMRTVVCAKDGLSARSKDCDSAERHNGRQQHCRQQRAEFNRQRDSQSPEWRSEQSFAP